MNLEIWQIWIVASILGLSIGIFINQITVGIKINQLKRLIREETEEVLIQLHEIREDIEELRINVAIMKGTQGHSIQMPYQGAKRGPKPKQVIEHGE